jgi:hypothetical protein
MSKDKTTSYQRASQVTRQDLRTVAQSISAQDLSRLSLPEVEAVVDLVSRVVPAGNVPGMILSGLARLPARKIPVQKMQQDIRALFSGVEQILDQAVYHAFFSGPAAIIWGYQNLLKLAGKEPENAFPDGVWQFYADYALREDTARHTNETHGFDTALAQHDIHLKPVDRTTAWVMASVMCLHQYQALLANEWYERVAISKLEETSGASAKQKKAERLYRDWETKRPFRREEDAANYDYPTYRRIKFEQFLKKSLLTLPASAYELWNSRLKEAEQLELSGYQAQMSILAYLEPDAYGERRIPFDVADAHIGLIFRGGYYLLPVCEPGSNRPLDVMTARAQIAAIMNLPFSTPSQISSLARVKRYALPGLRSKLNPMLLSDLDNLRYAPIIISADERSRSLPLSELRQTERGLGSHALTIFDTGETIVFDQSHIFFDGSWGTALSEIMTNEALSWARYLSLLQAPVPANSRMYSSLTLQLQTSDILLVEQAPHVPHEVGAENDRINLKACTALRKQFKQRSDEIQLTINDLLVLYRAIHAATYRPSQKLSEEITQLFQTQPDISSSLRNLVEEQSRTNPSILMPVDASQKVPRERVHPVNLEVPLHDLNLLGLHAQSLKLLSAYETSSEDRAALYNVFDHTQRLYLASLAGFGAYMTKLKAVAVQGESYSVGAIKLLAHLPLPIQRLLDKIPERNEMLNNLIKGREVFSNVGAVVPTSTLTRFITAKDDNAQKQLAWGVLTDAKGILHISLRDFRPHIATLLAIGRKDLANLVTQDYLDAYADGFNRYISELSLITRANRETLPSSTTRKRNVKHQ